MGGFNNVVGRRLALTGIELFKGIGSVICVAFIFCIFLYPALCLANAKEYNNKTLCVHTFPVPTQHLHAAHAMTA